MAADLRRMYSTKPVSAKELRDATAAVANALEAGAWYRLGERVAMARCAIMDLGRELERLPPEVSDG